MSDNSHFDREALEQRFKAEREKRLRRDGTNQYIRPTGAYRHFLDDPYVERQTRAPIVRDVGHLVIGAGFGGLLICAELCKTGVEDFCVIEKGGDFGGTWYWNRYPGIACDVESYIYLPMLEELGFMPSEKYSGGGEIFEYSKKMAAKFDLYAKAIFQTEVTGLRWDEERSRWIVGTDREDKISARFVTMATGPFQEPKLPGIPGVATFKGKSFHTSRWDFDYTGGNEFGNLTKLQDKTVGVIGTGATAVQCVPHLGEWCKQLYVFQRTPSAIDIRDKKPVDRDWFESLPPGWQAERMDNYIAVISGIPVKDDLIDDYWTKFMYEASRRISPNMMPEQIGELYEFASLESMERIRERVDSIVKDKATAEALKPWYKKACKRPCFHDEYLQTFNRPNVKLVNTDGKGVERITEDSVVAAGTEYKVDCLIYATGFELSAYSSGAVMPVLGRDGLSLADKWKNGATTMHGFFVHGFPNLMMMSMRQSGWAANFPHIMKEQARYIAYVMKQMAARKAKTFEVTEDAEREWVAYHEANAGPFLQAYADCTPGVLNNEGNQSAATGRNGGFGAGVFKLIEIFHAWQKDGHMRGLKVVL